MKLYAVQHDKIRLHLFWGFGEPARKVLSVLESHLDLLSDAAREACRLIIAEDATVAMASVSHARADLTLVSRIEKIRELGGELESETDISVHHYVVCDADQTAIFDDLVPQAKTTWAADHFEIIALSESNEKELVQLGRMRLDRSGVAVNVVNLMNVQGLSVSSDDLASSGSAFVLMRIMERGRPLPAASIRTFGVAGYYGLAGPSLTWLSETAVMKMLQEHLRPLTEEERNGELPDQCATFVSNYQPAALTTRLLLDAFPSNKLADKEPVPQAAWRDDEMVVRLDRGLIGLETAPSGKESVWVDNLRNTSRTLDMTIGFAWRMRLEHGTQGLIGQIQAEIPEKIDGILGGNRQSPALVDRTISDLEKHLNASRKITECPESNVEESLQRLDEAIATSPKYMPTVLRLSLWLLPALVALWNITGALYSDFRGFVFPSVAVGIALLGATGWVVRRVEGGKKSILKARAAAIDAISLRQEDILGRNILDCLENDIVPAVRTALNEARSNRCSPYKNALEEALRGLTSRCTASVSTGAPFSPVMSTLEDYLRVCESICLAPDDDLQRGIDGGLLTPSNLAAPDWIAALTSWRRQHARAEVIAASLGLSGLWQMLGHVGTTRSESESLSRMWRLAAPLLPSRFFTPGSAQESLRVIAPEDMCAEVGRLWTEVSGRSPEAIQPINDIPLLLCIREGVSSSIEPAT